MRSNSGAHIFRTISGPPSGLGGLEASRLGSTWRIFSVVITEKKQVREFEEGGEIGVIGTMESEKNQETKTSALSSGLQTRESGDMRMGGKSEEQRLRIRSSQGTKIIGYRCRMRLVVQL